MEVPLEPSFEDQRRRFAFCFTCEQCAHFDPDTARCIHGYPNQMHRLAYYTTTPRPPTLIFCKEFELR